MFRTKRALGLDIADRSIELVEVTSVRGIPRVSAISRLALRPGIVEHGKIADERQLALALKEVFAQAKPRPLRPQRASVSLSDSQVYLHTVAMSAVPKGSFDVTIMAEAGRIFPLPADDLWITTKRVRGAHGEALLLAGTSKRVITAWFDFLKRQGIVVDSFELEPVAIARGLQLSTSPEAVAFIDCGARTTTLAIFEAGQLRFSIAFRLGGDHLTGEAARALKISPDEAETKKRELGLREDDNPFFPIFVKVLESLRKGLGEAFQYYQSQGGGKVSRLVLVGGGSQLVGLTDYLSVSLEVPASLGSPPSWGSDTPAPASGGTSTLFTQAIGLALGGLTNAADFRFALPQQKSSVGFSPRRLLGSIGEAAGALRTLGKRPQDTPAGSAPVTRTSAQLKLLILVVVVGVVGVAIAWWLRGGSVPSAPAVLPADTLPVMREEQVPIELVAALVPEQYSPDQIRGRLIEISSDDQGQNISTGEEARAAAASQLAEGEELAPGIFEEVGQGDATVWRLVVYVRDDIPRLGIEKVKNSLRNRQFLYRGIEWQDVRPGPSEGTALFVLMVLVDAEVVVEGQTPVAP